MAEKMNINVRHVIEVDPGVIRSDRSSEVNDYRADDRWVILGTGRATGEGDHGAYAYVTYSVGWTGNDEPIIPVPIP